MDIRKNFAWLATVQSMAAIVTGATSRNYDPWQRGVFLVTGVLGVTFVYTLYRARRWRLASLIAWSLPMLLSLRWILGGGEEGRALALITGFLIIGMAIGAVQHSPAKSQSN